MNLNTAEESTWTPEYWLTLEHRTRNDALNTRSDRDAWVAIVAQARKVLRQYSTSFFLVTRFLPSQKRQQVEAVYAAVRYPDEIVDTFPWDDAQRSEELERWRKAYVRALNMDEAREMLRADIPCFVVSFVRVVQNAKIPHEYYLSFLEAMDRDIRPRPFASLDELISCYVYGSAVVVGFFLAYIYGPAQEHEFPRTLEAARDLGIALQLTNFLRDVREDFTRGRLYLPLDMLQDEGITVPNPCDKKQRDAFSRTIYRMAHIAEEYYQRAERNLDSFSPDSLSAINACLRVYRQLNEYIARHSDSFEIRKSVPFYAKFRVLPPSKYWRLPLAYLSS